MGGGTWVMNARTGERIRRISHRRAAVLDWSPDGSRLLFAPEGANPDLFILATNGTPLRRRTTTPNTGEPDAVWSPNGRRIAFVRMRVDYAAGVDRYSIWTLTARGTRQRRIVTGLLRISEFEQSGPALSWQPR